MESLRDSNCTSMSDSFSIYERYLRSFNVVDSFVENRVTVVSECDFENSCGDNIDLSVNKHYEIAEDVCNDAIPSSDIAAVKSPSLDTDLCAKAEDTELLSPSASLLDNSNATATTADHSLLTEKSDHTDVPVSSEDSKSDCFKQPIFITSTMENSNNAVDSVPLFRDTRPSESVFKLPITELSFNGTLKHVQKLKPIVDPITALTSSAGLVELEENGAINNYDESFQENNSESNMSNVTSDSNQKTLSDKLMHSSSASFDSREQSTGDSQYGECNAKDQPGVGPEEASAKWNLEQSYSSLEASFDSGVRSPDMFSEEEEHLTVEEPYWDFLKDLEKFDKQRVRKLEGKLRGILPPPSVTTLKIDATEMLKKYNGFLPLFTEDKINPPLESTPTKRVSFVQIPDTNEDNNISKSELNDDRNANSKEMKDLDTSADKSIELQTKMCSETEARETCWPDVLKCRYFDVHYNLTKNSEKIEQLHLKYAERYVGAETDTSVNVYSGGLQSPNSASKRKAMRLKMAQAKSPGRRLSHLARRRQAFCSAATISEKAHTSSSKMVYIDKNYFPHRKLVSSAERKSPRTKRTPGKKTPGRKTPGKKTPAKTPRSSSTKKKAMRRLLLDSENVSRSQPRESLKRALFVSPENRKSVPQQPCSSVPLQAMKSKRALFGSPITADTKSSDGTQSDQFLKRKRDLFDETDNGRSKIAKSLSFGGDSIGVSESQPLCRRASEVFASTNSVELNEIHKKKLLWAVTEALRAHGWRMSCVGFREKASALARLTRRLLALPPHRARLQAPHLSTSDTMLRLARQYVFAIIQGRSADECFKEEQLKLANDTSNKLTGYVSASQYQQMKAKQATTSTFVPFASQKVKENFDSSTKPEQPRSSSKNILQDKLVNIDTNSNSSSGLSMLDKVPLLKSNSMPSFEEAAKMRARRQISFDNVDFPKR